MQWPWLLKKPQREAIKSVVEVVSPPKKIRERLGETRMHFKNDHHAHSIQLLLSTSTFSRHVESRYQPLKRSGGAWLAITPKTLTGKAVLKKLREEFKSK